MAELFNPLRMNLTYECAEEVLQSTMYFGELNDSGHIALLDDDSISAALTWLLILENEWKPYQAAKYLLRCVYLDIPEAQDAGFPPVRIIRQTAGTALSDMMPPDTYYNVVFSGVRPNLSGTRGGQRMSGVPKEFAEAGRVDSEVTDAFTATIADAYKATMIIGGETYQLGILGSYKPDQVTPTPYFSAVDQVFLNPVLGSRKDRIPNRRNYPRGTCFPATP